MDIKCGVANNGVRKMSNRSLTEFSRNRQPENSSNIDFFQMDPQGAPVGMKNHHPSRLKQKRVSFHEGRASYKKRSLPTCAMPADWFASTRTARSAVEGKHRHHHLHRLLPDRLCEQELPLATCYTRITTTVTGGATNTRTSQCCVQCARPLWRVPFQIALNASVSDDFNNRQRTKLQNSIRQLGTMTINQ